MVVAPRGLTIGGAGRGTLAAAGEASMAITIPHFAPLGSMALSFDGRGGYVHVQDHPSLRLAEFTIEAWVRPGGAPSSTGALLARADALGGVCNYGLALPRV